MESGWRKPGTKIGSPPKLISASFRLTIAMYQQVVNLLFNYPEPINVALAGNMAAALLFCVISFGMDNTSMFDQYWAMAPVPIAFYYAFNETVSFSLSGSRKIMALAAVTVWAVRLFSLFFLKDERPDDSGGKLAYGAQHEDARYKAFRKQFGIFYWPYSFVFLHLFPALMLHWGTLPLYYAISAPNPSPVTFWDYLAFAFTIGAVIWEATADQQLMDFMVRKKTDKTLTICKDGLWSWSRHPNYFGEFSFWLGLWFLGVAASGTEALWTGVGALSVFGLFVGYSVPFMEERMKRYPEWSAYTKSTSAFIPFPPIAAKTE